MTSPDPAPAGNVVYAIKVRDVVTFSPHPQSKDTTFETVRFVRNAPEAEGAPADILQCVTRPNLLASQELMRRPDLAIAAGGQTLIRQAYSSGESAYGVGAGNATEFLDGTVDIKATVANCMLSKTPDFGSGCSADGNILVPHGRYGDMLDALAGVDGYHASEKERVRLESVMQNTEGHRLADTVVISPQELVEAAGLTIPDEAKFIFIEGNGIGEEHSFCREKFTTLLTIYVYDGAFENDVDLALQLHKVEGKSHNCGIASTDDTHVGYPDRMVPVSRVMVNQPNPRANVGALNNGMPMTSSTGCGTWGGNVISENVSLRHYMNTTWVSRKIPVDRPSDAELFGDFCDPAMEPDGGAKPTDTAVTAS